MMSPPAPNRLARSEHTDAAPIRPYPAVSFCLLLLASAPRCSRSRCSIEWLVQHPGPATDTHAIERPEYRRAGARRARAVGIESDQPPFRPKWSIPATGRPLREVLDALIAVEPGYVWEEMDGLVLIRPVERTEEVEMC